MERLINTEAEDKPNRIVFLGTPPFAAYSLRHLISNGFHIVGVVTAPDKPSGRGMKLNSSAVKLCAMEYHIPILQPTNLKDPYFQSNLKEWNADIQVVIAFRMLPESVWNMPPLGTINVHASLLPDYRGAAPINWAIINGERETGVTTFKLQHEIDTGDILLQKKVKILPEMTAGELHDVLMHEGAIIIEETLLKLSKNQLISTPQLIKGPVKHAPKIHTPDCEIDWAQYGEDIINKIRGLSPHPGAFTSLNGSMLKVFKAIFEPEIDVKEPYGIPVINEKLTLKFTCKGGYVKVLDIQLAGKKRMQVADFLIGFTNQLKL